MEYAALAVALVALIIALSARSKAGGLAHMPKGTEHFAWVSEDTIIQLHGVGPAGVNYVNPADDPRKK